MAVQNIYGIQPPSPEEHHKAIDHINIIVQGIHMQIHKLEGLAQANLFLTILNKAVRAQLEHMNVTIPRHAGSTKDAIGGAN